MEVHNYTNCIDMSSIDTYISALLTSVCRRRHGVVTGGARCGLCGTTRCCLGSPGEERDTSVDITGDQ